MRGTRGRSVRIRWLCAITVLISLDVVSKSHQGHPKRGLWAMTCYDDTIRYISKSIKVKKKKREKDMRYWRTEEVTLIKVG
jgi:hypothetical protein